jgi:hypothetical protein
MRANRLLMYYLTIKAFCDVRRTLQAMVRGESAGDFRLNLAARHVIEVLLVGPLPDRRDLGVVDLDFVVDLIGGHGGAIREGKDRGGASDDKPGGMARP